MSGYAAMLAEPPPLDAAAHRAWLGCAYRRLLPGAHAALLADRDGCRVLACAAEDAGFEVRDCLAVITAAGAAFVVLARRPLAGSVAENVIAYRTGGLHIDAGRVETTDDTSRVGGTRVPGTTYAQARNSLGHEGGRWPTNVLLDPVAAAALDAQAPRTGSWSPAGSVYESKGDGVVAFTSRGGAHYGDWGGAARYFPVLGDRCAVLAWLLLLIVPPGGRVLDPFASGAP